MRQLILKISAMFLAVALTAGIAGCAGNKEAIYQPEDDKEISIRNGVHIDRSVETENFILEDGISEYKIVIPSAAHSMIISAADEFVRYFTEATDFVLPILTDDKTDFSSDSKVISIGDTNLRKQANVSYDGDLGRDGFIIKTEGKSIFIVGGSAAGTRYGVYEFLYKTVSLEYFKPTVYTIDESVSELKLMNYDVVEIPDFSGRIFGSAQGSSYYTQNENFSHMRMTASQQGASYIRLDVPESSDIHNDIQLFMNSANDENDIRNNPQWMANKEPLTNRADQALCYNANGDEKERTRMLNVVFEKVKDALRKKPEANMIPITVQDNYVWCQCDKCREMIAAAGGANSVTALEFIGDLCDMTYEWFETEEGKEYKKDLDYVYLAYHSGEVAPDSEKYHMNEHITVWYAPIGMDFSSSVYTEENQNYLKTFQGWLKYDCGFTLWLYETNFSNNYMVPYDTFDSYRELCEYFAQYDLKYIYAQGQTNNLNPSSWTSYKAYLNSKYYWNTQYNSAELKTRFFNGYFQEAAPYMLQWFDSMQMWVQKLRLQGIYGGLSSIYQNMVSDAFWSETLLRSWLNYADKAIAAIEPLKKTDPERWQLLYDNICLERISPLYLMLEIHSANLSSAELLAMRNSFKTDARRLNVTRINEHFVSCEQYWQDWGI